MSDKDEEAVAYVQAIADAEVMGAFIVDMLGRVDCARLLVRLGLGDAECERLIREADQGKLDERRAE